MVDFKGKDFSAMSPPVHSTLSFPSPTAPLKPVITYLADTLPDEVVLLTFL